MRTHRLSDVRDWLVLVAWPLALAVVVIFAGCKHASISSTKADAVAELPSKFEDALLTDVDIAGAEYVLWLRYRGSLSADRNQNPDFVRVLDEADHDENGKPTLWAAYNGETLLRYLTTKTSPGGELNHSDPTTREPFTRGTQMRVTQGSLQNPIKLTYDVDTGIFTGRLEVKWKLRHLISKPAVLFVVGPYHISDVDTLGYVGGLTRKIKLQGFGMSINQAKQVIIGNYVNGQQVGEFQQRNQNGDHAKFHVVDGKLEGEAFFTSNATGQEWRRVYKHSIKISEELISGTSVGVAAAPSSDLATSTPGPELDPVVAAVERTAIDTIPVDASESSASESLAIPDTGDSSSPTEAEAERRSAESPRGGLRGR